MDKDLILTEFARVVNSDRYQYTESDVFLSAGLEDKVAIFDLYFRKTEDGGFAVVSGVYEVMTLINTLNSATVEEKKQYFSKVIEEPELLEYLINMKFTGEVYGMSDGEIVYPNEPILTIKAPIIQAKILETPLLNIINMQMVIATKASRITRAAHPVPVTAFGSRRAHGFDSAVSGSKAAYIGGCASHSNLMTEYKYDIPSIGTMAHSFIQSFGIGTSAEKEAFDTFIKHRIKRKNNNLILLIDTYNTLKSGILNAITAFKDAGINDSYSGSYGIRIDSGDLAFLAKKCRTLLDEAGFKRAKIILTNSLNEELIRSLKEQGTPVDIFGVGDAIAVSKSYPCFGGVYKIVQIDETPLIKLSEDVFKVSNPGFKKVYRIYDKEGIAYADLITKSGMDKDRDNLLQGNDIILEDEKSNWKKSPLKAGEYSARILTKCFFQDNSFTEATEILRDVTTSRDFYLNNLKKISPERKRLDNPHKYKVDLSKDLLKLKKNLINDISSKFKKES